MMNVEMNVTVMDCDDMRWVEIMFVSNGALYEGVSKICRTDAVNIIKLTIRPIGRLRPRSSSLPRVDTGPTVAIFWNASWKSFFVSVQHFLQFGLDLLNGIKPASFQLQFHFWR
jgi:hypothetical protein